jgi:hypothetical protein
MSRHVASVEVPADFLTLEDGMSVPKMKASAVSGSHDAAASAAGSTRE